MQILKFFKYLLGEMIFGSRGYYLWLFALLSIITIGAVAYINQLIHGMVVTNMSDAVSWGAYIANFTYLVGVAAAAVMLVIPAYIFNDEAVHEVVIIGELMAVAATIMCIVFVVVDLGSPQNVWHMIPFIGRFNWPGSLLSWDVIVLNGYLLLNLCIPGYLLYCKWRGLEPNKKKYTPFVFLSIVWAISIHTVTAFLYSGLGGRPYWNSAIVAPRFLASAFAVGPALLVLVFQVLMKKTTFHVKREVFQTLKTILTVALVINFFLLSCEVFYEFYTQTLHVASAQYLFMGLHGHNMLVPLIWTAIAMNLVALVILFIPRLNANTRMFNLACVLMIVGIWIEKGPGLIIPGFVPTPIGEIVEYIPSLNEAIICVAVWALGALIYTLLVKAAIPIMTGKGIMQEEGHHLRKGRTL